MLLYERNGVFNPILSKMLGERIHVELMDDGVSVEGRLIGFETCRKIKKAKSRQKQLKKS